MKRQLHKRLDDAFIRSILQKHSSRQVSTKQTLDILGISRAHLYRLIQNYQTDPQEFSVNYHRSSPHRIDPALEKIITEELHKERKLIEDVNVPIRRYNYTYLKNLIFKEHKLKVSVPTIINRAKELECYFVQKPHKKHDREVLTTYPGELIQHDASHHLFSPQSNVKWYLITSIDDYSRYLLYAKLLEKETSLSHISALEDVVYGFGIPLNYYVDSHSIFRFVQGRDSIWRTHKKLTDQVDTQFKQVLNDLDIKITYALSPQAKGKIERPYQWLQDHLVRTCARENITNINQAQKVLKYEVRQYNHKWIHSTTKEVPGKRLRAALESDRSLFREFVIPKPYESSKDIFCLRTERKVDIYHKVSLNNLELRVKNVPIRERVEIRMVPDQKRRDLVELRFWYRQKLMDIKMVKMSDLNLSIW